MSETNWRTIANELLGSWDVPNPITVQIEKVERTEIFNTQLRDKKTVVVVEFAGNLKPMVLNKTNLSMIESILGTPIIEKWVGKKITIATEKVRIKGKMEPALRVQKTVAESAMPIACEKCGEEIKGFDKYTAEQVAQINLKNHGKKLCVNCSKEMREEQ